MKRDVTFQLDTQGGGMVLQKMCQPLIDETTRRVAQRASEIAKKVGVGSGQIRMKGQIGAPNKRGGVRYYGQVSGTSNDQPSYSVKYSAIDAAIGSIRVH